MVTVTSGGDASSSQDSEDILKCAVADADLDTFMSGDEAGDTAQLQEPHAIDDETTDTDREPAPYSSDAEPQNTVKPPQQNTESETEVSGDVTMEETTEDEEREQQNVEALSAEEKDATEEGGNLQQEADARSQDATESEVASQDETEAEGEAASQEATETEGEVASQEEGESQVEADDEDSFVQQHSDDDDDDGMLPAGCIRGEPVNIPAARSGVSLALKICKNVIYTVNALDSR